MLVTWLPFAFEQAAQPRNLCPKTSRVFRKYLTTFGLLILALAMRHLISLPERPYLAAREKVSAGRSAASGTMVTTRAHCQGMHCHVGRSWAAAGYSCRAFAALNRITPLTAASLHRRPTTHNRLTVWGDCDCRGART